MALSGYAIIVKVQRENWGENLQSLIFSVLPFPSECTDPGEVSSEEILL